MLLSITLVVVDYFWLHFGGLDYRLYFDAWMAGGLSLFLVTLVPIYTLAILLILELVAVSKEHKTGWYLLTLFSLLFIANFITNNYGSGVIPIIGISVTVLAIAVATIFSSIKFMGVEQRTKFYSCLLYTSPSPRDRS